MASESCCRRAHGSRLGVERGGVFVQVSKGKDQVEAVDGAQFALGRGTFQ